MPSAGLPQDSQASHATTLTDSMSLRLKKVKCGMESPVWNVSVVDIHLRKLLWVYCPGHAEVTGNDRQVGKTTIASGLHLGRSEVLRSLRHYMRAQNQGHHTIDRLEERGVESGSARRSSSKGRDGTIVIQNEQLNLFKGNNGGNSDRRDGAHMCFSEHIDTNLK